MFGRSKQLYARSSSCFRIALARQARDHRAFTQCSARRAVTESTVARKEGDISSVFRSLSGGEEEALPQRFADVKSKLLAHKDELYVSWVRLLARLAEENEIIRAAGNKVIPEIDFKDIESPSAEFSQNLRRRGVAVVRQVVPAQEARAYKSEIEDYVRLNPWTKGESSVFLLSCLTNLKSVSIPPT